MNYNILFAISFSFILLTFTSSQEYAFGIPWDENRKLTWDDFQKIETSIKLDYSANIDWDIIKSFSWKFSETNECQYEFTKVLATATMDPSRSIVLVGQETAWVLNHEQRHFDIAEIFAKKFNERAKSEFLGKKFSCPSGLMKLDEIEQIANDQTSKIFHEEKNNAIKMQKDYDRKTDHSLDKDGQIEWNKKIDEMLKKKTYDLDITPTLRVESELTVTIKPEPDGIVKSEWCKPGRPCDTIQQIPIEQGKTVTYLISGDLSDNSSFLEMYIDEQYPILLEIKYPDSNIKTYVISETGQKHFEHPLEFDWESEKGEYEITVKHYVLNKHAMINISESDICEGICEPIIVEKEKTKTHLISGFIPDGRYAEGWRVEIALQFPDSSIKKYEIPVTAQNYFEYFLDFDWESQRGEHKLLLTYRGQEIQGTILNVESHSSFITKQLALAQDTNEDKAENS